MRDEQSAAPRGASSIAQIKSELLLRIAIQNLTLLISSVGFAGLATAVLVVPAHAWAICAIYSTMSLALLLQWCHHGVRTMQIKQYITLQECDDPTCWENWLPANRPDRLLGTRWLISTKGVFLGLQLAMTILAVTFSAQTFNVFAGICAVIFVASVGFLVTNPKE